MQCLERFGNLVSQFSSVVYNKRRDIKSSMEGKLMGEGRGCDLNGCDLNVKCSPEAHVFKHFFPSWGHYLERLWNL